jgi:hypothetical protein
MFIPDPGSGLFPHPGTGFRIQVPKKHRIPDPDPQQLNYYPDLVVVELPGLQLSVHLHQHAHALPVVTPPDEFRYHSSMQETKFRLITKFETLLWERGISQNDFDNFWPDHDSPLKFHVMTFAKKC